MEQDIVAIILTIIYFIISLIGIIQLILIIFYSSERKLSHRNIILLSLSSSTILRFLFWSLSSIQATNNLHLPALIILFFFPVWLNFAGLSVLALFYCQSMNYHQLYGYLPMKLTIAANLTLLILNLTLSFSLTYDQDATFLGVLYTIYATVVDMV